MFNSFKDNFDLPVEPLNVESGYFIMLDISKCRDLIPKKYLESHDYEDLQEGQVPVTKNKVFMADGSIPLDLAFCRWMAVERRVIMMPGSLFYNKDSPYRNDKCVRIGICRGMDHSVKAINRLRGKEKMD